MNFKHRHLFYMAAMTGILLVPFAGMLIAPTTQNIGNSTLAALPAAFEEDGSFNETYLSDLGDWFEDRFAFRSQMITADSVIKNTLFHISSQDDVLNGTDGWLFYSATLDDFQHLNAVSERTLFNEAHNLSLIQEWADNNGITFLFTIAPNKNSLYGEYMPDKYQFTYADLSDFERLIPYLEAENIAYVDLYSLFASREEILYYERDSHWNQDGALLAYNALLDAAETEHETYADVLPVITTDYYGDLSEMLYPSGLYPEDYSLYLQDPSFSYLYAGSYTKEAEATGDGTSADPSSFTSEIVEQDYILTKNEEGEGSLYFFRDSFGDSLLPYMAETYASAVFSKVVPYDLTGESVRTCDVLIIEKVERHLPTLSEVSPIMEAPLRAFTFRYTSGQTVYGKEDTIQSALGIDMTAKEGSVITADDTALQKGQNTGTIEVTKTSEGMIKISGTIREDLGFIDASIYAAITDCSGQKVYEAFCIGTAESDYGYELYIPEENIDETLLDIRIIIGGGESYICAASYTLPDFKEQNDAWTKIAEDLLVKYEGENPETIYLKYLAEAELYEDEETTLTETEEEEEEEAETDASKIEVSRQYIEDCGLDTGYWDITYADGHHEYIDN